MTKAVFMGSPALAIPSLDALAAHPEIEVVGVLAQPDRPVGRKRVLQPCPVKAAAQDKGFAVYTPEKARAPEVADQLRQWGTELVIVCAYGHILPRTLLDLPPLGCYNLHFSLLPRWRGASPIQAALLAGDPTTGVSLQAMVEALDAGDIAASTEPLVIAPQETAQSLGEKLAAASADLLHQALPLLLKGNPPLHPQAEAEATFCRTIKKEAGAVDFATETALEIERKCRAYTPWPGSFGFVGKQRLGLMRVSLAEYTEDKSRAAQPGVLTTEGLVATREGLLKLEVVKPEGKGAMPYGDYINGYQAAIGHVLTPRPAVDDRS